VIQPATPSDAVELRRIALASGIDAWGIDDYSSETQRPDSIILKATDGEQMVGFLMARIIPGVSEAAEAEIYNIAVSSAHRRLGIANAIFEHFSHILQDKGVTGIWLEVREGNGSAIAFYRKNGFLVEATRRDMYSDPTENALVMRCEL
jgi:ribosomal-protein-alanine N-acetyltransferase